MVSLLPAVLIGGPPHAGKSVLTYSLTKALRKRNIDHYVIRAAPDYEGDWSQEANPDTVRLIRKKGQWTPEFVKSICRDLEHRHFPLLVDMGGKPQEWQNCIFLNCTHTLLLLLPDEVEATQTWLGLTEKNGLLPLGQLYSKLDGQESIDSVAPLIKGTITGLERNTMAQGPLFDLLVERIAHLFSSYTPAELKEGHLATASAEVVDLDVLIDAWAPQTQRWEPAMIPPLLAELPANAPVAIYGRGTNWVYGFLAAQTQREPFYQFDSRLGWVTPPLLQISSKTAPELEVKLEIHPDVSVLSVHLNGDYIDYTEAEQLPFPPASPAQGLIISGKLPYWLITALVRLYRDAGVAWIACYQPQLGGAFVVMSKTTSHQVGDVIALPAGLG